MLMQNFKSADDLGITEPQKEALMKTLVLLETGRLKHVPANMLSRGASPEESSFDGYFNMEHSFARADCGTVACIRGTAMMVGNVKFDSWTQALHDLFYAWEGDDPDDAQAATALRSYLTTGDARWDLAVA